MQSIRYYVSILSKTPCTRHRESTGATGNDVVKHVSASFRTAARGARASISGLSSLSRHPREHGSAKRQPSGVPQANPVLVDHRICP